MEPPPPHDKTNDYTYMKMAKPSVLSSRHQMARLFHGYSDCPAWAAEHGTMWFLKRKPNGGEKELLQLVCTRKAHELLGHTSGTTNTPYMIQGLSRHCWRVVHMLSAEPAQIYASREEAMAAVLRVSLLELMAALA